MKLIPRRRSKAQRAVDAAGDLARLQARAKVAKGTARAAGKAQKLKAVGGTKTGRRAMVAKTVAGRRSGRRAAATALAGKALGSSAGREAGRTALRAGLAAKAARSAKKRRGEKRRRNVLVLGGVAAAVGVALKARSKGGSAEQPPAWTPSVPATGAPADVGAPASDPATLAEDAPNAGATGLTPEAVREQAGQG